MRPWRLKELTLKSVKEIKYEVAVLPVASTEPHNLHLPYGSDIIEAEMIADRVCEMAHENGAKVVLLPTIPFGVNSNLFGFPLTIHVDPSTHLKLITDIATSLENHNILKMIIFNGHGGNNFYPIARELYGKTKVFISVVDWWRVGGDMDGQIFENNLDHADEMETSVLMELCPELVHLEDADDGAVKPSRLEAINKGWAKIPRPWHLLTKNSGSGDPRKASREKGKKFLDVIIERLSRYIYQLSEAKMDETFPY